MSASAASSRSSKRSVADREAAERQLAAFIDKFAPPAARLIRDCRSALQALLPTAFELVYDNYNFFVIGYCATARPSDCIVSIAAAANGVGLSFYRGASLDDPGGLLEGQGRQNRFIRLPQAERLQEAGVVALIQAAVALGKPLPATGAGQLVIQSVSAKQRPRQRTLGA